MSRSTSCTDCAGASLGVASLWPKGSPPPWHPASTKSATAGTAVVLRSWDSLLVMCLSLPRMKLALCWELLCFAIGLAISDDHNARHLLLKVHKTQDARISPRCDWTFQNRIALGMPARNGSVAEWFKALVLKTSVGETLPWVRIPPLPPPTLPIVISCYIPLFFLGFSVV